MKTKGCAMLIGFFFLLSGLFLGMPFPGEVHGAGYPDRAITLVAPFAPGGITDLSARALAQHLEKQLKQPVVVLNKVGGNTTIGGYAVTSAKPDGYTLGFFPDITSIPELFSYFFDAPYSSNDLKPICRAYSPVLAYFVNADAPWNSMKEVIDFAQKNPGMKLGHPGKMTPGFAAMRLLNKTEKTGFIDVPFDSDAKVLPAVLGGHIPMGAVGYTIIKSLYEAKKVKVLAFITIPKRAPFAPEIPTLNELGYKIPVYTYHGVFGPKGIPDEVVKKIDEAVSKVIEDPDFQTLVKGMGTYAIYENTATFEKSLMEFKETYRAYLKDEGMVK